LAHEDPAGCSGQPAVSAAVINVSLDDGDGVFEPGAGDLKWRNRPVVHGDRLWYQVGALNAPVAGEVCTAFDVDIFLKKPEEASFPLTPVCTIASLPSSSDAVLCSGAQEYIVSKAGVNPVGLLIAAVEVRGNVHDGSGIGDPDPTDPDCILSGAQRNPNTSVAKCFHAGQSVANAEGQLEVTKQCISERQFGIGGEVQYLITISNPSLDGVTMRVVTIVDSLTGTLKPADPPDPADITLPIDVAPGEDIHLLFNHTTETKGEIENVVTVTAIPFNTVGDHPAVTVSAASDPDCLVIKKPEIRKCLEIFNAGQCVPLANLWLCNVIDAPGCDNKASGVEEVNFDIRLDGRTSEREPKCIAAGTPPEECPFQQIGAFEFEVRYDSKLLTVDVERGGLFDRPDAQCTEIRQEHLVQFRCNLKGKPADAPRGPGILASVRVRATSDVYSMLRAAQDNGIVTQLINQDCQLADLQGHPIKTDLCENGAVTIRYLEGDVHHDCRVDVRDQQQIAFRWGARLGQLLYNENYDLEPSAPKLGDGDIDAKDLQTVYGRHGSTCKDPHPPQPPVDPKAKVGPPPA
jgi:hypothetical protein